MAELDPEAEAASDKEKLSLPYFMFPLEILFWKTSNSLIYDLETGETTEKVSKSELKALGGKKVVWSENDINLLKETFQNIEVTPDNDYIYQLMSKMPDQVSDEIAGNRKIICNQLLKLGLVSTEELKSIQNVQKSHIWRENHLEELKILFEEFYPKKLAYENGDSEEKIDLINEIKDGLSFRPKPGKETIIRKILDLKLVDDRKKLRASRRKTGKSGAQKSGGKSINKSIKDLDNIFSDDSSDDGGKSEAEKSSSESDDDDGEMFRPGVISLEMTVLNLAKSVDLSLVEFLKTEFKAALDEQIEDDGKTDNLEYDECG